MNTMMKLTVVTALGIFVSGCWIIDLFTGPHGFKVKTTFSTPPSPTQSAVISPDPNVQVIGNFQGYNGLGDPCGGTQSFNITTGSDGTKQDSDWAAPGVWNFTRNGGHTGCGLIFFFGHAISCGQTATLNCGSAFVFGMTPDSIDVNAPPATATFTGQGLDTTYGMPTLEFYDEYGTYFSQTTATAVSADGTWLQTSVPSLAGLYSGIYTVVIVNATADGSRNAVGTASVWVYGNDMPAPPPDPLPDPNPCGLSPCLVY